MEPVWHEDRWQRAGNEWVWVALIQWALGAYERYLAEGDEKWLVLSLRAAERLVEAQESKGPLKGGWVHAFPLRHTFPLRPPWLSGMAQGEAASLLVRLGTLTSDERLLQAAVDALGPMGRLPTDGGVRATLDGGFFPEEYPTDPPSYVLNGAIFALWGCYDVAHAVDDADARELSEEGIGTLARTIHRFDTGSWSRYDLFPGPTINLSSPAYHDLHIAQLRALAIMTADRRFEIVADRFQRYGLSRVHSLRAVAHKAWFRVLRPRNRILARLVPGGVGTIADVTRAVVLCYHGVSEDWDSSLAVTPVAFEQQIRALRNAGLRAVTFTEAAREDLPGTVAITFDDAFSSVFELAAPILRRYGMPATVFVPTAHAGAGEPMQWPGIGQWLETPHEHELLPMSWAQLLELRELGWEIGSHTHSHPRLTKLAGDALAAELCESQRVLEAELGVPCRSLAYPYGDLDHQVVNAARQAEYEFACTLPSRPVSNGDPLRFPRIGIYRRDGRVRFRLKISPLVRRIRTQFRSRAARLS